MAINIGGNLLSSTGFNSSSEILNTPNIVTDGLFLWYDAGNLACYNSTTTYYDCGYGCQYYSSDPGCTNCNTQLKDMSGYGNDGTFVNGSYVSYSNVGGYIFFDGTDDYINSGIINLQQNFTLDCWAYITGDGSGLFGQGVYGTGLGLHILWNAQGNRGMVFGMYANDLDSPGYTLTYNVWHHFVFTYNHSTYQKEFYADGSLINYNTGTIYGGSGQFNVGAIYGGALTPAKGNISVVKAYNKVLSATEITQNFNNGRQRFGI